MISTQQKAKRGAGLLRVVGGKLAAALVYPHSVEHYLQLVSPRLSVDQTRAEVVEVIRETADVVTLVVRPGRAFPAYQAGQYVALTAEVDGVRQTRCFSLSSSPSRTDGLVTITIKARAQGGLVSPFLVTQARPGLQLSLSEPAGEFVLPAALPDRLLFISGGSGITPCMSMLRTLCASGYRGRIVFMHFARTPADVIFGAELRELASKHDNITLVIETESERGAVPDLNEQSLRAVVADFEAWDAWVCGPTPLMNAAQKLYAAHGADKLLRTEQFTLARSAVVTDGEAVELTFARSHKVAEGDQRTLLEQAEELGLNPKSGCRMGICQTCRCKKLAGVTKDIRTGEISSDANVEIKLCVSVPVGDVSIDL